MKTYIVHEIAPLDAFRDRKSEVEGKEVTISSNGYAYYADEDTFTPLYFAPNTKFKDTETGEILTKREIVQ